MTAPTAIMEPSDAAHPADPLRAESGRVDEPVLHDATLFIPIDRCYWAIMRDLPKRIGAEGLRYAFEPWLPAPLESVETRFVRTGDVVLACGVARDWIQQALTSLEDDGQRVESLRPAVIPECVNDEEFATDESLLQRLEFRSGDFGSPRRRRQLRLTAVAFVLTAVAVSSLLVAGFMRRVHQTQIAESAAHLAIRNIATSALGPTSAASLDPQLRLAAEVRRLESTRDRSASGLIAEDSGLILTTLLAAWPADIDTQVDSIRIDPDLIAIRGRVRDAAAGESLNLALESAMTGWIAHSSAISKGREGYDFAIVLGARDDASSLTGARR